MNKKKRLKLMKQIASEQRVTRREQFLWLKYRLTSQVVEQIKADQHNSCLICGSRFTSHRPYRIDHCHNCEQFRALLCNPCNVGLGYFKDDIRLLAAAIVYLQDHECSMNARN